MITIPEEIKKLIHSDGTKKNIRITFPDGERTDICNDMILNNTFKLTESLCSQSALKFGLCEVARCEFSAVGIENLTGANIDVFTEIFCDSSVQGAVWRFDLQHHVYPLELGTFIVDSCKRDSSMEYRKVVAYQVDIPDELSFFEIKKRLHPIPTNSAYTVNVFKTALQNAIRRRKPTWTEQPTSSTRQFVGNGGWFPMREGAEIIGDYHYNYMYVSATGRKFEIVLNPSSVQKISTTGLYWIDYPTQEADINLKDARKGVSDWAHYFCDDEQAGEIIDIFDQMFSSYGYSVVMPGPEPSYEHETFLCSDHCIYPELSTSNYMFYSIYVPYSFNFGYYDNDGRYHAIYYDEEGYRIGYDINQFKVYEIDDLIIPQYNISYPRRKVNNKYQVENVTTSMRDLLAALCEINGLFFKIGRGGYPEMIDAKKMFDFHPNENVFPGNTLYPGGLTGGKMLPCDYQSAWYDEEYVRPYGAISIAYKDSNNDSNLLIYYFNGFNEFSDVSTYKTYKVEGNAIIDGTTWTQSQIRQMAESIAQNLKDVNYISTEIKGRGLPYVEPGDTFEVLTATNDSITTIVLQRTLQGEQLLTDTYKSN